MTIVRLQRHAPEAHNATRCAVCDTADPNGVTDHVQVGPPGTPTHDEGVCEHCGAVLGRVVERYGSQLTMVVNEAQREASAREITTPSRPAQESE